MTFLRPKVALWRYQMGNRSLAYNVEKQNSTSLSNVINSNNKPTEEEVDQDVPSEIEDVIDSLLNYLKDEQTIVR